MNMDIIMSEQYRTFKLFYSNVGITCNDIEYSILVMFFVNLNTFGKYYWDGYVENTMSYFGCDLCDKIRQIETEITNNIDYWEETRIKQRKRDYKIDSILN